MFVHFIFPSYELGIILSNCENGDNALLVEELFENTFLVGIEFWPASPGSKLVNIPIRKRVSNLSAKNN
jgi:hypothetical protein